MSDQLAPARTPRVVTDDPSVVDRWFNRVTLGAGIFVLVLLALVGLFLLLRSRNALSESGIFQFLTRSEWRTDVKPPRIGVFGLLMGTVLVAAIAVSVAIPLGTITALFITEYSTRKSRRYLTALVDLLAAIPSLLYGLWGFLFLSGQLVPLARWMTRHFGWIPLFATDKGARFTGSMFIAGIVVSLMALPIVTSVVREVFAQTPPGEKEAALALGATRWGMIRAVVLPYGRGGIIGGSMLGLGRALGETIAVALLLPQVPQLTIKVLQNGGATVSGFIAQRAGSDDFTTSGLMAAGLVLFLVTLATNMIASVVVSRSRSGVGVDL
ncbi:MAG: phosphate ABC transporter permease subunit PstC [Actinomycetota bacterium]|nr:phosphate ABC transporter permease subunit PstC [Actinomycetota bacterium]